MSAVDLTGNLESFSLFGLLQFLSSSHASGSLLIEVKAGVGRLELVDGEMISARFDRVCPASSAKFNYVALDSEEAALALLEFSQGKFEYAQAKHPLELDATRTNISVPALLMEAARIADELERLGEFLPRRESHLSLVDVDHVPMDPLDCSLSTVFATHRRRQCPTSAQSRRTGPSSVPAMTAWEAARQACRYGPATTRSSPTALHSRFRRRRIRKRNSGTSCVSSSASLTTVWRFSALSPDATGGRTIPGYAVS